MRPRRALGDVLADRVALVAVNPPLPLFEVDWVGREVPVDHGVAVRVEVEALLPDRGAHQDERPDGELNAARSWEARAGASPLPGRGRPRRAEAHREGGVEGARALSRPCRQCPPIEL